MIEEDDLERRDGERRKHDSDRTRSMRLWLAVLTALWVATAVSLSLEYKSLNHQNDHFKSSRVESKTQSCDLDRILLGVLHSAKADQLSGELAANYHDCLETLKTYKDEK